MRRNKMLTGKQKRYLRGLGSLMNPVAYVGKEGLSEAVIKEVSSAIESLELVKVRIGKNGEEDAKTVGSELADALNAQLVQVIGRNCLLFKEKKKESAYKLP